MTNVFIEQKNPTYKEGSSFDTTAYFRSSANAAEAPTTAKYRVDCLTTKKVLTGWTSLTPAVSNEISITATENAIQSQWNRIEKKQLTVAANPDTATQTRDILIWDVENIRGF